VITIQSRVELLAGPATERAAADLAGKLAAKMFSRIGEEVDAARQRQEIRAARRRFVAAARADLGASSPTA
jgi:hypothetical protein